MFAKMSAMMAHPMLSYLTNFVPKTGTRSAFRPVSSTEFAPSPLLQRASLDRQLRREALRKGDLAKQVILYKSPSYWKFIVGRDEGFAARVQYHTLRYFQVLLEWKLDDFVVVYVNVRLRSVVPASPISSYFIPAELLSLVRINNERAVVRYLGKLRLVINDRFHDELAELDSGDDKTPNFVVELQCWAILPYLSSPITRADTGKLLTYAPPLLLEWLSPPELFARLLDVSFYFERLVLDIERDQELHDFAPANPVPKSKPSKSAPTSGHLAAFNRNKKPYLRNLSTILAINRNPIVTPKPPRHFNADTPNALTQAAYNQELYAQYKSTLHRTKAAYDALREWNHNDAVGASHCRLPPGTFDYMTWTSNGAFHCQDCGLEAKTIQDGIRAQQLQQHGGFPNLTWFHNLPYIHARNTLRKAASKYLAKKHHIPQFPPSRLQILKKLLSTSMQKWWSWRHESHPFPDFDATYEPQTTPPFGENGLVPLPVIPRNFAPEECIPYRRARSGKTYIIPRHCPVVRQLPEMFDVETIPPRPDQLPIWSLGPAEVRFTAAGNFARVQIKNRYEDKKNPLLEELRRDAPKMGQIPRGIYEQLNRVPWDIELRPPVSTAPIPVRDGGWLAPPRRVGRDPRWGNHPLARRGAFLAPCGAVGDGRKMKSESESGEEHDEIGDDESVAESEMSHTYAPKNRGTASPDSGYQTGGSGSEPEVLLPEDELTKSMRARFVWEVRQQEAVRRIVPGAEPEEVDDWDVGEVEAQFWGFGGFKGC